MIDASLIDSIMSLCLSVILYMCSSRSYKLLSLRINVNRSHFSIVSCSLVILKYYLVNSVFRFIGIVHRSIALISLFMISSIIYVQIIQSYLFFPSLYIMLHLFSTISFFILNFGLWRYSYIYLRVLSCFLFLLLRSFHSY